MIILDFGSGNTCKNDFNQARRMITELARIGSSKDIVIKWQLFQSAAPNQRLSWQLFERAYIYAGLLGFKTTASVFDKKSLDFLLTFDVPFIKIANSCSAHLLAADVPNGHEVVVSTDSPTQTSTSDKFKFIRCISEYPAKTEDYIDRFGDGLVDGISDHTEDFELFHRYAPKLYECHYKLHDSTGLDAGQFARTPEQLKEILL